MPMVYAHRGLSAEHPENTLAAFRAAAQAGFDGIELDVRLTHDEELVCLHDASIDRTTDGKGRVDDMEYDELRTHPTADGPVPRLTDVFAAMADWRGAWNVELKARRAAGPVVDALHHHEVENAIVSCMDPDALQRVRDADPDQAIGLVVLGPPDGPDLAALKELACEWVNVDHAYVTKALVERLHAVGAKVGAWTVNDPVRAHAMAEAGVDALITDVRAVLEARAGWAGLS